MTSNRAYDSVGRVTATEFSGYSYDAAGRITSLTQNLGAPADSKPLSKYRQAKTSRPLACNTADR